MDDLRQLIRDLIAMRVGMEVKGGQPTLTVPPPAEAMVRNNLDLIRAGRDEVVRLWAELSAESRIEAKVCKECQALILDPVAGATSRWTFCEYLYCPYRRDQPARRFQRSEYEQRRLAEQRRTRAIALDEYKPEPIPE